MCSPMKLNRRFGVIYRFHLQGWSVTQAINQLALCFMLVSCLPYSSPLKMGTIYSSEILAGFHRAARLYIPEDRILEKYSCFHGTRRFISEFRKVLHWNSTSAPWIQCSSSQPTLWLMPVHAGNIFTASSETNCALCGACLRKYLCS
jgi:hypothetical protein